MINWEKRYRDLFSKYYNFNLSATFYLDNEIDYIDHQIHELQLRREKLLAIKHTQSKERLQESERAKTALRLRLKGKLPDE